MSEPTPVSSLRRLDDRVVPTMQSGAQRAVAVVAAPALLAHRVEQRLFGGRLYRWTWQRRALVRTVAVALALGGSAIHLQRYPDLLLERESARAAALQQTISRPDLGLTADLPPGARVVGAVLGQDPQEYIDARTGLLTQLEAGRHVAIVSLHDYVGVDRVLELLPSTATVLRAQYKMPDIRATPLESEVVAGDLRGSIDRIISSEVALLQEEEQGQQELLDSGTIQSEEFERDARGRLDEIRTIRNVLAATGGIVFAVLVEADAAILRELARDQRVRLVDVLGADADPATSVVFGIKPDDRTSITFGVPPRG